MNKQPPALQTVQLTVHYEKRQALWDVTVTVPRGKLVAIIGPNGAGKSTFINAILNIVPRVSGKVLFFGLPLHEARRHIGYVPQKESVDWDFPLSVKELVMMGRYGSLGIGRRPAKQDKEIVDHYLHQLGIASVASRQIGQLSGGQQQRAFIARALAQEADLFLLDEPFKGVDVATETMLISLFQNFCKKGKTVFVIHHDLAAVRHYFDWTIILNKTLIACGPTAEVFTAEALNKAYGTHEPSLFVQEFFHFPSCQSFGL